MKTYTSFENYLRSIRSLPEVESLLSGTTLSAMLLETCFSKATAAAFEDWYDARTYSALITAGAINGYPGDRAAFSLALKAAFFKYRYAWPKVDLDKALEAIARSLPPVDVMDAFPEVGELVSSMKKRLALRDSYVVDNPKGEALQRILGSSPRGKEEVLAAIKELNKQESQMEQAEQDASEIGRDTNLGECDCPACRGLRQPAELAEGVDSLQEALGNLPPELREKLNTLRKALQQRQHPLDRLLSEARALREALSTGKLEEAVSMTLDVMPPEFGVANIQVGLTLIAEQGFGDVVEPYVAAVRNHGRFPDFTATPQQGSVDEATYNAILAKIREQLNA